MDEGLETMHTKEENRDAENSVIPTETENETPEAEEEPESTEAENETPETEEESESTETENETPEVEEESESKETEAETPEAALSETDKEQVKSGEESAAAEMELDSMPFVIQKTKIKWPVWTKVCVITLSVLFIIYGIGIVYFTDHFMWNTTLNGLNVSMLSEQQAKNRLDTMLTEYRLEILPRDGKPEYIEGSEIGLEIMYTGTIEDIISHQNVLVWFLSVFQKQDYSLGAEVHYDRIALYRKIHKLDCMQKENIIEPIEPQIIQEADGFSVEEGQEGKKPIPLQVRAAVEQAVSELSVSVDLDQEGCYERLEYSENAKEIQDAIEYLEALQKVKITYRFPEDEETLTGDRLLDWADISRDYHVTIDREKVKDYIEYLKETYEIRGQIIDFQTTYGQTVEITSYIRSEEIDTDEETEAILKLLADIQNGGKTSYVRDSSQLAGIGDTYIEINLTSQHLYCYKEGEIILETDFVSGQPSTGHATPPGIFTIRYKSSPAILVGENYRTPVSYWMPFNGGIGLHDATWQSAFGGSRYIGYGSHGCINLPLDMAKAIYENYDAGDLVIVYHLPGTESGSATPAGRPSSSPIPVATEEPPATEAATEAPAEPQPPVTEVPAEPQPPVTEAPTEASPPATEAPIPETTTTENPGTNPSD